MKFVTLGATDAIGASCHFVHVDGTGLVLDAGLDPEEDGPDAAPDFDVIHRNPDWYVDHAIVTHAHHDHMGALPVLMQHFPHAVAHMTPVTRDLVEYLLPGSARLQQRRLEEGTTQHEPLYDEEELDHYSHLYLAHELGEPFDVSGLRSDGAVEASFYDAGHILGSAGVLLRCRANGGERTLFYSSDTNTEDQTIIPGGQYPEAPVDVLVLESTAGNDPEMAQTTRKAQEERFGRALSEVLGRGGTVLVPVFALGRAQEVIALLGRYKRQGLIDADVPIYTAGSQRAIADLYDKARSRTPRVDPEFTVYGVEQQRLPRKRDAVSRALEGPSVHVVSSGMMFEPTLSNRLARQLVSDPDSAVLFVGYAKEDSPAERLQTAAAQGPGTDVVLSAESGPQPVRCRVDRFRLSGHSHRDQLVGLVERMRPEQVVLVHGDEDAKDWMEETLRSTYPDLTLHRPGRNELIEL